MSEYLNLRVTQQKEYVHRIVDQLPEAKYAVDGLVAIVQDAERERIIALLRSEVVLDKISWAAHGAGYWTTQDIMDDIISAAGLEGEQA